ncbi:hypothetical protein ACJJIF_09380 [Microbulbifer sp. SSSA002]|uniref:hypothetical protein n=1 Tax=unclassified Microbulbifer TaxID=2619833 RepID=UPI00403A5BDC
MQEPQSVYIFQGLVGSFVLNLVAFGAILKTTMAHQNFKYVLAYLWSLVILGSLYWGDLVFLYVLAAGLISYEYYKKVYRTNI